VTVPSPERPLVYERGRRTVTVEVPVVDELPAGATVGDLVALNGFTYAMTEGGWLRVRSAYVALSAQVVRAGGAG
jgi:hypothetical protein